MIDKKTLDWLSELRQESNRSFHAHRLGDKGLIAGLLLEQHKIAREQYHRALGTMAEQLIDAARELLALSDASATGGKDPKDGGR